MQAKMGLILHCLVILCDKGSTKVPSSLAWFRFLVSARHYKKTIYGILPSNMENRRISTILIGYHTENV